VGDLDQTSSLAGISAWSDIFDRFSADKWRSEQLTVNYRTPAPVMDLAGSLLRAHGREPKVSASAREGDSPVFMKVESHDASGLVRAVNSELARQPGRLCVIAPRAQCQWAREVLAEALGASRLGEGVGALDAQVSVMTATQAKGLEFDAVVMLEPAAILGESVRGPRDLYVALTRPTSRLVVLHSEPLPSGMHPVQ
jgi:DNA helicase IV